MKSLFRLFALLMLVALPMHGSLADGTVPGAPYMPDEYAAEFMQAQDALLAHTPGAAVDYAVREYDDGRYEWDVFFTLDGRTGMAEIPETDYTVRRVRLYDMPEGGLTASQIAASLVREKGDIQIIDLELDTDDGRLVYEGEAMLDGKRYEFEISATGRILDWERD